MFLPPGKMWWPKLTSLLSPLPSRSAYPNFLDMGCGVRDLVGGGDLGLVRWQRGGLCGPGVCSPTWGSQKDRGGIWLGKLACA